MPAGSGVALVIVSALPMVTVNDCESVCGVEHESVATTVKVVAPGAVGVPESRPADESVRPFGSGLVVVQAIGATPPFD